MFENNDEDKDPTNLEEFQEWKRKDCKAHGYILKTTKVGLYIFIYYKRTIDFKSILLLFFYSENGAGDSR
jgi:hypothetical protein